MNPKITVEHVYPPIPQRCFDYCAYVDAESGPHGWGSTKEEAIANLEQLLDEKEQEEQS